MPVWQGPMHSSTQCDANLLMALPTHWQKDSAMPGKAESLHLAHGDVWIAWWIRAEDTVDNNTNAAVDMDTGSASDGYDSGVDDASDVDSSINKYF